MSGNIFICIMVKNICWQNMNKGSKSYTDSYNRKKLKQNILLQWYFNFEKFNIFVDVKRFK